MSRPGWASGNALVVFWEGADGAWGGTNNRLSAHSYDGNAAKAVSLSLTYTTPVSLCPLRRRA